jgi:hypothetical protein
MGELILFPVDVLKIVGSFLVDPETLSLLACARFAATCKKIHEACNHLVEHQKVTLEFVVLLNDCRFVFSRKYSSKKARSSSTNWWVLSSNVVSLPSGPR